MGFRDITITIDREYLIAAVNALNHRLVGRKPGGPIYKRNEEAIVALLAEMRKATAAKAEGIRLVSTAHSD